jgi:hypothetical protein
MFALVENNQFVKIVNSNKGIEINGVQYPKSIFTLWSNDEREAIGIYEVTVDSSNKKDEEYYINTDVTYVYDNNSVTGSYGTATAKPLDNVLFTQADDDADEIPEGMAVGDIKSYGLKPQHKQRVNDQANGLLSKYDWYVIRNTEDSTATIPSDVSTYRTNVRAKANEMCTQIDNASDVDALKTLYTYTEQEDGTFTRPLAEFPEEL